MLSAFKKTPPLAARRTYRLLLGGAGGYAFANGVISFLGAGLSAYGLSRGDAVYIGLLLGLVAFLLVIIWAAATTKLLRTSIVLITTSALMNSAATLLVSR